MEKYCINCKHHRTYGKHHVCYHPSRLMISNITGKAVYKNTWPGLNQCSDLRNHSVFFSKLFGMCGKSALWYEEK
jgi:hypothetical protein